MWSIEKNSSLLLKKHAARANTPLPIPLARIKSFPRTQHATRVPLANLLHPTKLLGRAMALALFGTAAVSSFAQAPTPPGRNNRGSRQARPAQGNAAIRKAISLPAQAPRSSVSHAALPYSARKAGWRISACIFALIASLLMMRSPAVAQTWTGDGGSGAWSDAANWAPGAPTSGTNTELIFGANGNGFDPTNNAAGFTLNFIQMDDGFTQTVTGQSLIMRGINPRIFMHSNADVTLTNDIAFIDDSGGFQGIYFDGSGTGNLTLSGVLSSLDPNITDPNFGRLAVQNGLTITLSGANTYYGRTDITGASLIATNDFALGAATAGTFVNANSTLALQGNIDLQEQVITLNGTGVGGNGALRNLSGNNTVLGAITLGGAARIQSDADTLTLTGGIGGANQNLTFGGAGDIVVDSAIATGTGSVTVDGSGTTTFSGTNTYAGGTFLNAGVLSAAADDNLGGAGGLTFDGGTLQNTAAFTSARGVTLNAGGGTFRTDANLTLSGVIAGAGALTKSGGGALVLTGDNTYTGGTTIAAGSQLWLGLDSTAGSIAGDVANDGTLVISRSNTITLDGVISGTGSLLHAAGGVTILNGDNAYTGGTHIQLGTVQISGDANLGAASGAVTMNVGALQTTADITSARVFNIFAQSTFETDSGTTFTLGGAVSGTANLTKTGGGALVLAGANAYSGGTTISAGTLRVSSDANLGHAAGPLTFDGGVLQNTASFTSARSVTINAGGGTIQTDANLTLSGMIAGAGALTKTGSGALVLSGTNSYAGGTTITAGTLQLGNGGTSGSILGDVLNNGTLAFNRSDNITFDGQITGSGVLNQTGTGTTILAEENTYTGGTTISAGTLQLGNGSTSGSILGDVLNNGTLAFNRSDDIAFDGQITGTGVVNQIGAGTTILTEENNYTGGTMIAAGTLQLGDGGTSGSVAGDVVNDGTLTFNRSNAMMLGGAISGAGVVNQIGAGTTILTGDNSYTGATNVNAGTLQVNGDQSAATGLVTVAGGATLGGSGTLGGDVTVADGGTLAPGTSPGTLTMGALALSAGSILDFELGEANAVGGPLNDLINVNGDLTLDGTLNVTPSESGLYDAGIYRLIDYSGVLTDNGLELGLMPDGSTNVLQTSIASQVNLINTQGLLLNYWDGPTVPGNGQIEGGDGVWQASAGNEHWSTADGLINASYQDAAMAIFSGASGIVTVDDSLGAVRVTGMQFAADGYRLEGDAVTLMPGTNTMRVGDGTQAGAAYTATIASVLTGDGALGKSDLGTLVLAGENTYTGGTTISAGTLQLGDGGTTGSIVGDIANAGTLSFYRSDDLVFDGLISGSGTVEQIGSGTMTLTGTNTYTGITSIFDGVLALSGAGSVESSSNVRADGIFDISATDAGASIRTLSGNGTAVLGSQALTLTAASGIFGGAVTGPGSLIMDGTGSWTLTGTGSEVGALDVRAGALEVANGASFAAQTTNIAADATLTNDGSFSGTADADGVVLEGALIGSMNLLDGDDEVQIAGGADFSQAGFDGGDGIDTLDLTHGEALTLPAALAVNFEHLIKRGTGEFTLEGAVDGFSDSIDLTQGATLMSNAAVTTGEVRIASGASLMGTGSLSGGLSNAGLLSPGMSPGTITIGGNFVQSASGTLLSEITPAGTDLLDIGGSATLAGTHQIQIEYGLYLDGTTHTLIEAAGGITGDFDNVEINPSALMTAERELSATAGTVSFARLPTTTITDPGTNKENYAEWLDDLIAADGLTPDMIDYVDLLLQQPTADAAGGLLGEIADPIAGVSQNSVATLGAGFAGTVFERFAANDLTRCIDGETRDERNCAWIQGLRKWGDADGDRFGPGYDWTTDGVQLGYDRKLESDWTLGVTLGFVETDTEDLRGGRNDLRSRMAGLYASYTSERFGFSAIAQYADNENRTARDVVIGTTSRVAGATFDSDSYGLGARVDYRLMPAARPLVRPFAELFYDRIDGDEFVEAGAETGDLSGRLHDRHGLRLTAGLQFANDYVGYDRVFRPSLELGVVRQLQDTQSVIDLQPFDGASSFRAYGVELDRTAYVAQASLGMTLGERTSAAISYGGERGSNYSEQEVNLGFRIVW